MTPAQSWRRSTPVGIMAAVIVFVVLSPSALGGRFAGAAAPATCSNTSTVTLRGGGTPPASSGSTTTTTAAAGGALGGSAGTDISLPNTASCQTVTVSGGGFGGLRVSVNQTDGLVNQAISVTWAGGTASGSDGGGLIATDYLQMMECWGDDGTGTGPPPEQCQFGAEAGGFQGGIGSPQFVPKFGAYPVASYTSAFTRGIATQGWTCGSGQSPTCQSFDQLRSLAQSDPSRATYDSNDAEVWDPFRPVPGACNQSLGTSCPFVPESVNEHCCLTPPPWTSSFDQNPYFNHNTSNEVDFARTYAGGVGQQLFTVDTGLEAPGLGCGQAQTNSDGSDGPPPQCWLVVVPRGSASYENPPQSSSSDVATSPLSPGAWANRIAIKLGFQPIGSSCNQSGGSAIIVGSELAGRAVGSWQPALCAKPNLPSYNYIALGDDTARTQLLSGSAGMAVVSRPVDPAAVDQNNPLVYAPLTLSGLVIGFDVQRSPVFAPRVPPDEVPLFGTHVTRLNLTPRLVAKVLTASYQRAFGPYGLPTAYTWGSRNPQSIVSDPDFLQFNPEFKELLTNWPINAAQLVVEAGSSDAAHELWRWILGDKAAADWLSGAPDPWGMKVNPYFTTTAAANPTGKAFDDPPIDNIPQNDPYTFVPSGGSFVVGNPPQEARPLHFQDWDPYTLNMGLVASDLAAANSGSHTTLNLAAPNGAEAWSADGPQTDQSHTMLGVTTTDQADLFGVQAASLSQAGDDGPTPTFIAPDAAGLTAGTAAMEPSAVSGVLTPSATTTTSGAYPLTMLTYAAVAPVGLSTAARTNYANFITYAAGDGQVSGFSPGNLPLGYVPLPSNLAAQSAQAAATILDPSSLETTTTTSSTTTTPSNVVAASRSTTTTSGTVSSAPTQGAATATNPAPPAESVNGSQAASGVGSGRFNSSSSRRNASPAATIGAALAPSNRVPTVPQLPATPTARTARAGVGLSRYAIVLALLVGLGAAVSSQLLLVRR